MVLVCSKGQRGTIESALERGANQAPMGRDPISRARSSAGLTDRAASVRRFNYIVVYSARHMAAALSVALYPRLASRLAAAASRLSGPRSLPQHINDRRRMTAAAGPAASPPAAAPALAAASSEQQVVQASPDLQHSEVLLATSEARCLFHNLIFLSVGSALRFPSLVLCPRRAQPLHALPPADFGSKDSWASYLRQAGLRVLVHPEDTEGGDADLSRVEFAICWAPPPGLLQRVRRSAGSPQPSRSPGSALHYPTLCRRYNWTQPCGWSLHAWAAT